MQMSARVLGKEYGLTGEEMNRVLLKNDILKGTPGDYSPTSKGLKYVVEKEFHSGNGGYSQYNRNWTTRTFDESIKDVLDVTEELISDVREEIASARAARRAAQKVACAKADEEFLTKQLVEKASEELAKISVMKTEKFIEGCKRDGKITLIVGGIVGGCYTIYRLTPKVKSWWANKQKENGKDDDYVFECTEEELDDL